jgi:hypothetical protein
MEMDNKTDVVPYTNVKTQLKYNLCMVCFNLPDIELLIFIVFDGTS